VSKLGELELKLKVEKPDADLFSKIWSLYEYYRAIFAAQQELQMNIAQKDGKGVISSKGFIPINLKILGFLESEAERRVLIQLQTIRPEEDSIKDELMYAGWIKPSVTALPATNPNFFAAEPANTMSQPTPSP